MIPITDKLDVTCRYMYVCINVLYMYCNGILEYKEGKKSCINAFFIAITIENKQGFVRLNGKKCVDDAISENN